VTARLRRRIAGTAWRLDQADRRLLDDLLEIAAGADRRIAEQGARIRHLEDLSITDELTGLLNRRGFRLELERALARARRHGETGILLLCDLDRFKPINDSFGHPAGDAVLCAVAELLHGQTRCSDYIARLGGDEFAVIMTDTAPRRATARAAGLRLRVNQSGLDWNDTRIAISASFGSAAYGPGSQFDSLMATADRELYRDKPPRLAVAV
jgi:diguanylate cyclase (GGDEF)-like protein